MRKYSFARLMKEYLLYIYCPRDSKVGNAFAC